MSRSVLRIAKTRAAVHFLLSQFTRLLQPACVCFSCEAVKVERVEQRRNVAVNCEIIKITVSVVGQCLNTAFVAVNENRVTAVERASGKTEG